MCYLNPMLLVPAWLGTIARSVDEWVEKPAAMKHWQNKLREWSSACAKEKDEPTAFPLPPPARAVTLLEKYAALAAIHDVTADAERPRIDPFNIHSNEKLPDFDAVGAACYSLLFGYAREMAYRAEECERDGESHDHRPTLEKWLGSIELDISQASATRGGKGKKPRGRPHSRDPVLDAKIYDAWKSTCESKYEDALPKLRARFPGLTLKELKGALDSHQHRLAKPSE